MRMMGSRLAEATLAVSLAAAPLLLSKPAFSQMTHEWMEKWKCSNYRGDDAIKACTRAIESGAYKGEDLAHLYNARGNANTGGSFGTGPKDYDRAVADFSEAIRISPELFLPYYNRGLTYWKTKDYDLAIADLSEAIRLVPSAAARGTASLEKFDADGQMADAYFVRASVLLDKGERDKAIADLRKVLEHASGHALAREKLTELGAGP